MKKASLFILTSIIITGLFAQSVQLADDFAIEDGNGNTYHLFDTLENNTGVVLAFFGVYCQTCQNHVPELNELAYALDTSSRDFTLWGIDASNIADQEMVNQFAEDYNCIYPTMASLEADSIPDLYDITYTPQYVVICPNRFMTKVPVDEIYDYAIACEPTGIENNETGFRILSYHSHINIHTAGNEEVMLSLLNSRGQLVHKGLFRGNTNISTNGLSSGIYILRLQKGSNLKVKKLIIR